MIVQKINLKLSEKKNGDNSDLFLLDNQWNLKKPKLISVSQRKKVEYSMHDPQFLTQGPFFL